MWPNPQETADLVTLTEEIFNAKLHFLCSVTQGIQSSKYNILIYFQKLLKFKTPKFGSTCDVRIDWVIPWSKDIQS